MESRHPGRRRPPLDDQFTVLANEKRRRLLLELFEAHRRNETPVELLDLDELAGSTTILHQHLPILEDRGFVYWDRDEQLVAEGPHFGEIEPLLEVLVDGRAELPYAPEL